MLPTFRPVYLCANVGMQGLLVVRLPAPFIPYSASLGPTKATRVLSAPPTGLDKCFLFYLLGVGLPCVRFSVSSGCARRRSVSTYAAILVLFTSCLLSVTNPFFVKEPSAKIIAPDQEVEMLPIFGLL